jgi:transcriptional regulator with XRE-family HTH domain
MTWPLFDAANADSQSQRGFKLLGQLVLRRRRRLGLSQRQLEHLSGVDQTVISRLENGRLGGLRWSRFARLVDALGGLGEADQEPGWTARFMPHR